MIMVWWISFLFGMFSAIISKIATSRNNVYIYFISSNFFLQYLEKRKELRSSGYSDKEASDCVAFLCVEDEELMYKICRDGVPIGNYPQSCLGHPMMGKSYFDQSQIYL